MLNHILNGDKNLVVLKGFNKNLLDDININPLLDNDNVEKLDYLSFDKAYVKELFNRIMTLSGNKFITYEEFLLIIEELGEQIISFSEVNVVIVKNNYYPEYYYKDIDIKYKNYYDKLLNYYNNFEDEYEADDEIKLVQKFIGDVKLIDNKYFCSFKLPDLSILDIKEYDYYNVEKNIINYSNLENIDEVFELTSDIESYLRVISYSMDNTGKNISIVQSDDIIEKKYEKYITLLIDQNKSNNYLFKQTIIEKRLIRREFYKILYDVWGYKEFKDIDMYKSPDENKDIIRISQGNIIEDIVKESENALKNETFKDIFITAPTGAGKSIIFQLSALYLSKKYETMTIIISPLIALMKDQVTNLAQKGICNVAYLNSELNFVEKENVIKAVKDNKIDILYLAPETLLSSTIESIIGNRKISLFIVDESHIVTTWGKGFRPDYWYLGSYIKRIRNNKNQFPICTFTATAVYGGNDDMYDEIIESLNMKSTIKYLGSVKRDDISFNINIKSEQLGFEQYNQEKTDILIEKIRYNVINNIKTVIYFPYASTALDIYEEIRLRDLKEKISIYTAKVSDIEKNKSFERFIKDETVVMLATKAFGMGIDIGNIIEVYHYAPTGNLSDYIQEIGRAARDKILNGIASTDFNFRDFNYIKQLTGMSSINQNQIRLVLKKLHDIYKNNNKQNFLITPLDFAYIFTNESRQGIDELERKLKTALLIIEKDLETQFKFPVMISRPRSMLSKVYVIIDRDYEEKILNSKFGKYFSKISSGRKSEKYNDMLISDMGDIYLMDIKSLWEDEYPSYSFASFKYLIFKSEKNELGFEYKDKIHLRYKITLKSEKYTLNEVKYNLIQEIDYVNSVLDIIFDAGKMFTVQEFSKMIDEKYNNKSFSDKVASAYINLIKPSDSRNIYKKSFIEYDAVRRKYRFVNRSYHNVKRDIFKNSILKKLNSEEKNLILYHPNLNKSMFDTFKVLYLLELFELLNYELSGGENPEIFIRLNDPKKILRLSRKESKYSNLLLKDMKNKHEKSIQIMNKFFTQLNSDEERWNFIEDYFLGEDVLNNSKQI